MTVVTKYSVAFTIVCAFLLSGSAWAMHGGDVRTDEPGPVFEGEYSVVDLNDPELEWEHCGGDDPEFLKGCTLVQLHTEPETGSLQFFVRTPAGFEWPLHWHTNAEFLLGLKGLTTVEFEQGGTVDVSPGVFLAIEPRLVHSARCTEAAECRFYLAYLGESVIFDFNVVE